MCIRDRFNDDVQEIEKEGEELEEELKEDLAEDIPDFSKKDLFKDGL